MLEANRVKWRDRGPTQYTYQFQRSCYCVTNAIAAVFITVNAGQVVTVVREDGQPVSGAEVDAFYRITIDSLFGIIGDAIDRDAAELHVGYDERLGYPTRIAIDYDRQLIDEEVTYTATLPPTP